MNKRFKILKIYYIPLFIALIVAITQFVLSSSFTLTRWEGGGFGMYSEPYPDSSRFVGISLKNSDGELNLRLNPPDDKLSKYINKLKGKTRDDWDRLIEDSDRIRRFPKYALSDDFMRKIANELLHINYDLKIKMKSKNNLIMVNVYVMQLNMNIKENSIQSKILYSKTLDI